MTLIEALAVLAAGFTAGGINAIVGSGSLVTFPVLLAVGYALGDRERLQLGRPRLRQRQRRLGYRRELEGQRERALMGGAGTALGAIAGGVLLLTLPEGVFEAVVPVLILLACALMIARPKPKLSHGSLSHHRKIALVATGFAVGVYGGYFGAAQGVILLAALRFLIPDNLQRLNGLKNVMVGIANGIAAILFVIVAHVAWDAAALVAVGSIAGAQLGARYGRRIPDQTLALDRRHRRRDRRDHPDREVSAALKRAAPEGRARRGERRRPGAHVGRPSDARRARDAGEGRLVRGGVGRGRAGRRRVLRGRGSICGASSSSPLIPPAEVADPFAQRVADLGDALRPEQQQDDDEEDADLEWADVHRVSKGSNCGIRMANGAFVSIPGLVVSTP